MSRIFDALARVDAEVPPLALAALVEELEAAKSRIRGGKDAGLGRRADPAESQPKEAERVRTQRLRIPPRSPLIPFDGSNEEAAEQYRIARTRISQDPRDLSMIVVSSAGRGDGKTVTAINLAVALALTEQGRVLLVDADLRRGSVARQLGLVFSPGLADVLEGRATVDEALVRAEQFPNCYIMTCGKAAGSPGELLDSPRWRSLAKELRQSFEYVVIDSAPVEGAADYRLVEAVSDGTLVVLRPDHTPRRLAAEALSAISKERLVGVLWNSAMKGWSFV